MTNYARQMIQERLNEGEKKQLTFNVRASLIEKMDKISEVFGQINNQNYPRNSLLEDAIISYINEIDSVLREDYDMNIFGDEQKNNQEPDLYRKENNEDFDTVVYPGYIDGFEQAFKGECRWYYVRIKKEKIPKVKYIAIYLGSPISAITHYAKVLNYQESKRYPGRYFVNIDGNEIHKLPHPIQLGDCSPAATRAPKYTTLEQLKKATTFSDL